MFIICEFIDFFYKGANLPLFLGCEILAKTESISRHDKAAAYLHWTICKYNDIEITDKWYEHKPETVMHNEDNNITIMWDQSILMEL